MPSLQRAVVPPRVDPVVSSPGSDGLLISVVPGVNGLSTPELFPVPTVTATNATTTSSVTSVIQSAGRAARDFRFGVGSVDVAGTVPTEADTGD